MNAAGQALMFKGNYVLVVPFQVIDEVWKYMLLKTSVWTARSLTWYVVVFEGQLRLYKLREGGAKNIFFSQSQGAWLWFKHPSSSLCKTSVRKISLLCSPAVRIRVGSLKWNISLSCKARIIFTAWICFWNSLEEKELDPSLSCKCILSTKMLEFNVTKTERH